MRLAKVLLRASILLFSALCLLIFQLGTSVLASTIPAYAEQPFPTVVPVDPDFEDPIDEEIPTPIPLPTIGPGSTFDKKPDVKFTEEGDEEFGYGPLEGSEDLYAVWTTDENGTHYVVVHKDSALLRGSVDSVTGERYENGFEHLIDQREAAKKLLVQEVTQGESRLASSNTFVALGTGLVVAAAGICIIVSLGACAPVAVVGSALLVAAFTEQADSSSHLVSAINHAEEIASLDGRLNERLDRQTSTELEAPQGGD